MTRPNRRSFLAYFSSLGLSATLFPGVLWAQLQESKQPQITMAMLKNAAALSQVDFSESEYEQILSGVNDNLGA